MKKAFVSAALAVSAVVLSSCAISPVGLVYTDTTLPVTATSAASGGKVGTATPLFARIDAEKMLADIEAQQKEAQAKEKYEHRSKYSKLFE